MLVFYLVLRGQPKYIIPVYFKVCSVSLLAALRNRTRKIKTYISEKQNYNSSAAQRVY